ncbi:MAG: tetratricopeptide repeat protein [Lachnospiraceae bacterium]
MKKIIVLLCVLAACALSVTGCSREEQKEYEQAESNLNKGYYEKAITGFESAVANDLHTAQAYRGIGVAQFELGVYEEAVTAFTQALNLESKDTAFRKDVLAYMATAQLNNGAYEDALATAEQLVELGTDTQHLFLLGKIQLMLDQYDTAQSYFEEYLNNSTTYTDYIRVYEAYNSREMNADGDTYLEAALNITPKTAQDYYDLGCVYYYLENTVDAQKQLELAVDKGSTDVLFFLGKLYLAQGDASKAQDIYQTCVDNGENIAQAYNGLAACAILEENFDEALAYIEQGLEEADTQETQELLYSEIVVYEKQLDFATAKTKMADYIALYPEDETAQRENTFLQNR